MSGKKLKTTPFARLFLFLILFAPVAYLGASYYNGEDGIENIKKMFGGNQKTESYEPSSATNAEIQALEAENQRLLDENKALKAKIKQLEGGE